MALPELPVLLTSGSSDALAKARAEEFKLLCEPFTIAGSARAIPS